MSDEQERDLISLNSLRPTPSDLPDFVREDADMGTELVGEHVTPPRVKVVQPLSKAELKAVFRPGDVIVTPQLLLLADVKVDERGAPSQDATKAGNPFYFVPIFFFVEYLSINPREVTALPMIRERSFDSNSPLAHKCRASSTWTEECPEASNPLHTIRNCESLCWVVMPIKCGNQDITGTPIVMPFMKGEHRAGSNFAALIRMRSKTPLFACVYEATAGFRTNSQGEWYGVDVSNPTNEDSFIRNKDLYDFLKEQHLLYKTAHERNLLVVDHEADEQVEEEPAF